jgi:hypothetical protein
VERSSRTTTTTKAAWRASFSWNRYAYVKGDPVNNNDPSGLDGEGPSFCDVYRDAWFCSPYPLNIDGSTGGGPSGSRMSLEEAFASMYNVSISCAHGLFESAGTKNRPTSMTQFGAYAAMLDRANASGEVLQEAAESAGIDWKLLAAIGVRESGFQNIAQGNGGAGTGVFQIDLVQNPSITEEQAYDLKFSSIWAANYLATSADTLEGEFGIGGDRLVSFVAASYNRGVAGVRNSIRSQMLRGGSIDDVRSVDMGTTFKNYGQNILYIRECFK